MAFTPKSWADSPSTSTPITAAALQDLETRVTDYADTKLSAPSVSQPTRTIGTAYQPSTSRVVLVTVSLSITVSGFEGVELLIGATSPPATHVGYLQGTAAGAFQMGTFLVPPGWYYKIGTANGTPTIDKVTEWVL